MGTVERLRRDPKLREIPVMVTTGSVDPLDATKAEELGCVMVAKPFLPEDVVEKITHEVVRETSNSPSARVSIYAGFHRFDGALDVPPGIEALHDAIEAVLRDDQSSLLLMEVKHTSIQGQLLGTHTFTQLPKTAVTAITSLPTEPAGG